MTRELNDTGQEPESERLSSTFRDFVSLGAGVTPAEGSVKPTAGFTLDLDKVPLTAHGADAAAIIRTGDGLRAVAPVSSAAIVASS